MKINILKKKGVVKLLSGGVSSACVDRWMALLKYFQKTSALPNPNGPLSSHVPPSSIASANKEVKPLVDTCPAKGRGKYSVDEEKLLKWE